MRRPFALLIAVVLSGCPGGKPCKLHSDCAEIERCLGGSCTVICRTDRDCEGLGSCLQGQCVLVQNGGGEGGGSAGGGSATGGGVAGGSATGGGTAGGGGSGGGATGGGATGGGATGGGATGGGSGGGSALGQYGDACTGGSQCQSNLCVGASGMGICTISCADESACMPQQACIVVGGTKVCVPSDSGNSCPNGSGAGCFAGICVQAPVLSASVCATPCTTTRACPSNMTCSPVGGVNGRVCVPAGAGCSVHGPSNSCVSRFCAAKATNASDGICTNLCRDRLDCPTNWACGLDDDGSGGTISVCQPVGDPCSTNASMMNDCYSQTCGNNGSSDYCTALCMNTQLQREATRCPAGWSCSSVPVGTETWYACEPP